MILGFRNFGVVVETRTEETTLEKLGDGILFTCTGNGILIKYSTDPIDLIDFSRKQSPEKIFSWIRGFGGWHGIGNKFIRFLNEFSCLIFILKFEQ